MKTYHLILDASVQWFAYIVELDEKNEVLDFHDVPTKLQNPYLDNIWNRKMHGELLTLDVNHNGRQYYGQILLSEYEFMRVRRMIELFKCVEEYERLGKLEKIQ